MFSKIRCRDPQPDNVLRIVMCSFTFLSSRSKGPAAFSTTYEQIIEFVGFPI